MKQTFYTVMDIILRYGGKIVQRITE